jgi:hypothetical protein
MIRPLGLESVVGDFRHTQVIKIAQQMGHNI